MEAKEEVDGVLGALGEAQDPSYVCVTQTSPSPGERQWDEDPPLASNPEGRPWKDDATLWRYSIPFGVIRTHTAHTGFFRLLMS